MAYQYDALPEGKWFRLLRIHPGSQGDPLELELMSTAMAEAPDYTALSYVWGDPTKIGYVELSGITTRATLSLIGGLSQLRSPDRIVLVWADAICINQGDIKEKGSQVNMMGAIYDQAEEVFVWLGEDPKSMADRAFYALPRLNAAVATGRHRTWHETELYMTFGNDETKEKHYFQKSIDNLGPLLTADQLDAIKHLYQIPWFTRVWVLQEVGLASKATACWGESRTSFSEIAAFVWFVMHDHDLGYRVGAEVKKIISGCPYAALYAVWSTYGKKNSWIQRSPTLKIWADHLALQTEFDFVLVLEASRSFNATDARDHIYAFLGHPCALVPGSEELMVRADYELDLNSLYRTVAEEMARICLNFLVQAQNTDTDLVRTNGLPSWVPRWDSNIENAPVAFWEVWDASLRKSKQPNYPVRILDNQLHVSAVNFDTVRIQTEVMRAPGFDRENGKIGAWLEEIWDMTERAAETVPHRYPGKRLPREPKQLTIIHNRILALAAVLGCMWVPKGEDAVKFIEDAYGHFLYSCFYFNEGFYFKVLEPLGLRYPTGVLVQREFAGSFEYYGSNRRFFVTEGGYWGLGPAAMQEGDVCAVLFGADVPFVLRPMADKKFRLVGESYVYGVMNGELLKDSPDEGSVDAEEVCIV